MMLNWKNLDTLASYEELKKVEPVNVAEAMSGENGAERVKNYSIPMMDGLTYNYAAKAVDDKVLAALAKLAGEAQLIEKYESLYNGAVINTGENRLVLHQLTRGQLGDDVVAEGVNKREFYVAQQQKIADFANKVHAGEITNAAGEKFTTVVQIGIGGSDLGPRAMYLALENWAKVNNKFKMEAKFISNVDPDDAAAVLNSIDVAHSIFILVSKSGTTLETLTNESFVKDALAKGIINQTDYDGYKTDIENAQILESSTAAGKNYCDEEDFYLYVDDNNKIHFALISDVNDNSGAAVTYDYIANGAYTKNTEYDNTQLEFDPATGRITSMTIPTTYDADGKPLTYTTFDFEAKTVTDEAAYQDAYNQYEYETYLYDQKNKEINAKTEVIQQEDKNLELKLQRLDNERTQITTEIEAVEKVINDNIEASYKTFSG